MMMMMMMIMMMIIMKLGSFNGVITCEPVGGTERLKWSAN
jgi:hypothetical protein